MKTLEIQVTCLACVATCAPMIASAGTITFEGHATIVGYTPTAPGLLTSLNILDPGTGVTAHITRTGPSASFDVWDLSYVWYGYNTSKLSPFNSITTHPDDKFMVNFTVPAGKIITDISINYGDYGNGSASGPGPALPSDFAHFRAWSGANATGALLSDQSQFWNGVLGGFNPAGGTVGPSPTIVPYSQGTFSFTSAVGIKSLQLWGEEDVGINTLFWDNLSITIGDSPNLIPLPHAGGMAVVGLGLLAARRRRTAAL